MSTKVDLKPINTIIADLGVEPNGKVQKFFTNTCYRYMDKYVPMDTGNLRTVVTIGPNYVEYEMPYAHYQYVGQREDGSHKIKNHTTAGTTTYWDIRMWNVEKDNIIDEVQTFMGRG